MDAYDLILKNKERLLSFEEPVRFIFSHSALREGWDNPNVFVIWDAEAQRQHRLPPPGSRPRSPAFRQPRW